MAYNRKVKFNYYQITNHILEGGEEKTAMFSVTDWAKNLKDNGLIQKHLDLSKCKAKVEYIKHNKESGLWKIRLLRLGEYNIPQTSKNDKSAEDILLEEDEYLGFDVNIIYDELQGIAMIQRNRMSLSIERITELLQFTSPVSERFITILPILNLNINSDLSHNGRRIELSFANIVGEIPETESAFSDIINSYYRLNGMAGSISIGVGRGKDITTVKDNGKVKKIKTERFLDSKEFSQLINDVRENNHIVQRGMITLKDEDDPNVEIVDLFDDVFIDTIFFKLESRQTLGIDYVMTEMIEAYTRRKTKLVKSIYKKE